MKQDFYDKGASSSNIEDIIRELAMIQLQTNPCVEEVHQQVNIESFEESKHSALVKSFLHSFLHLLRDEKAILEIQNLIDRYDQSMFVVATKPA